MKEQLFSFKGRANRGDWWATNVTLWLAAFLLGLSFACITDALNSLISNNALKFVFLLLNFGLFIVLIIALCVASFAIYAKRFHDLGWSGKWLIAITLFGVITTVYANIASSWTPWMWMPNLILLIICGFFAGNTKANKYGEPPINAPPIKYNELPIDYNELLSQNKNGGIFSFKGRINRHLWFLANIFLLVGFYVLSRFTAIYLALSSLISDNALEFVFLILNLELVIVLAIALRVVSYAIGAKRLHDIGWSGKWLIHSALYEAIVFGIQLASAFLTPNEPSLLLSYIMRMLWNTLWGPTIVWSQIIIVWAPTVICVFWKGNAKANKYGEPIPKRLV